MAANKKLTAKQQVFVDEYLIDLNATQAAIRAGYSPHTAKEQGCQNLTKLNISEAIATAKAERSATTGITAAWVLEQAADVYREARQEQDRPSALKAIDTVGKHVDVQAFTDKLKIDGDMSISVITGVKRATD